MKNNKWAGFVAALLCLSVFLMPVAHAHPGYALESTPLDGSSQAKVHNIERAVAAIDGVELYEGDEFSFNDLVGPRTSERGFRRAANGRGVQVVGGGVAQAASTLYLALLQIDGIEYNKLHTYGDRFVDNYVSSGYHAIATDYESGLDFSFTSYYSGVITINMWVEADAVYCFLNLSDEAGSDMVAQSSTPVFGTDAKIGNIELAADRIFGTTLYPDDEFSFNDIVGPRTGEQGFRRAVNGRGAQVTGGGVAQVASAVYLAVKYLPEVAMVEKHTYGDRFTEWYVEDIDDAIMTDYSGGRDFAFRYEGEGLLVIYTYLSDDDLICEVYEYR